MINTSNALQSPEIIEDENALFPSTEEAIYALYEQLFDTLNAVCPETILKAMKYLVFTHDMEKQMEEMRGMLPCDVSVLHHREVDKGVQDATKEMKKKLYQILEDKLF